MVWWLDVEIWMVVHGPNSRAHELACEPHAHRLTIALPRVLGGIGMYGGLENPSAGVRKKNTIEESHEETELSSNVN